MKVAALDLGTNTFLCLIAEVEAGQITKIYDDQVRVVRLGQEVDRTKQFHPEALTRARQTLTEFAKIIELHKPQKVLAMATSAARDVSNAAELFQIGKDLSIPIQIIPGEREAEITYRGAVSGSQNNLARLVVDIGGGSTELIVGRGSELLGGLSLDLGCVRLTEKFHLKTPCSDQELESVKNLIRTEMQKGKAQLSRFAQIEELLAVAGTPTELARIEIGEFDAKKIDGYQFSLLRIKEWSQKFQTHSKQQIIDQFGIHPGRADVILVGTLILSACLEIFGLPQLTVSTRGVRYGVALEIAQEGK